MSLAATPSQTVGPFFSFGLCERPASEVVPPDAEGTVRVVGRVTDGGGAGVFDAMVEIWHPDVGWGRCGTSDDGDFSFIARKPDAADGQAPHLEVIVFARGLLKPVFTRLYFPDEEQANAADPVLGALGEDDRAALIAVPDDGSLRFDVRLQGERQTTFFAL